MNIAARRHAAFTLMEMVTSCVILSMVMLSLGYGLKLALVSTGTGAAQSVASLDASDVVERVTDDMNEALNFTEKTAQAVTFTVPDRGTDGTPDTIRYQWWPTGGSFTIPGSGSGGSGGSGSGGELLGGILGALFGSPSGGSGGSGSGDLTINVPQYTLTRQVNGGDVSLFARDVRSFNLNYLYRTMSPPAASTPAPDRLLWQHDPVVGVPQNWTLNLDRWIGESFVPQLPAGTTSWSVTRIALYVRGDAPCDGVLRATFRSVNTSTNAPNTAIASASIGEVAVNDSYSWVEFSFPTLTNLSPTTKYAIVIEGLSGTSNHGTAGWVSTSLPPSNTWLATTTTRGIPWTMQSLSSLRYKIYGTTTP
jgi:hypothetical protein